MLRARNRYYFLFFRVVYLIRTVEVKVISNESVRLITIRIEATMRIQIVLSFLTLLVSYHRCYGANILVLEEVISQSHHLWY